jgi:uncharacterized protein (DUF885 family)
MPRPRPRLSAARQRAPRLFVALVSCASLLALLQAPLPAAAAATTDPPADPAGQARALFERDWQWRLKHQPEFATAVGDHRYDAQLADSSLAAGLRAIEHARRMRDLARQLDPAQLTGPDRLSWEMFVAEQERRLAVSNFVPFDPQPISIQDGFQLRFPGLVAQMPFVTEEDYRNYLARLGALPRHIDGIIEQLREGVRTGWVAPKAIVAGVPAQLRSLREHLADSALAAPLRRLPATIPEATRARLADDGAAALQALAPALQKLETFIRSDYLPAARDTIAAAALPGGAPWYALLVKNATTTAMTPAEIHALGLKEVARLRAEMAPVVKRTGFRGTLPGFFAFARSDPRLFYTDPEALLNRYRRTIVRAYARLPLLFGTIPPDELAVKPLQGAEAGAGSGGAGQGGAAYEAGTPQRMAALVVNTARLDTRPLWEIETLALHEGVPGHHLQVARAQALTDLPAFRKHAWYPAYGEGWALYAEGLGPELGLLRDPFSEFGRLADELLRAARLVIDTGIHARGWTRRQALDYLNANTANPVPDNEVEVDRAIAQPGQVLAYKIGQLRILALRNRAQALLGERFDVRAFHDAVLGQGALPLDLLERQIERWIAAQNVPQPGPQPAPAPAPPAATPPDVPAAAPPSAPAPAAGQAAAKAPVPALFGAAPDLPR